MTLTSRAAAQAIRAAQTQCPRPYSRNKMRARCWQNRPGLTSGALWNLVQRKPGYGRTFKNIMTRIERAVADAKAEKSDRKTINKLTGLLRMFIPKPGAVKKAQRGH